MGGYAFYVWTSLGVFFAAMLIDFISLNLNEKSIKRQIKSLIKRKKL
jgi:heme exporter protein CcmD